jgi:hypothetical protein
MKSSGRGILLIALASLATAISVRLMAQTGSSSKEVKVSNHISGSFDVKMIPQSAKSGDKNETGFGRMLGDKQYHGDLEATAKVEMIASGSGGKGSSGAYVALEKVTGTVKGREGSFVLVHTGIMTRGTPQLTIAVVPDSGTGQLAGISGTMTINIAADGKHSYDFSYGFAPVE